MKLKQVVVNSKDINLGEQIVKILRERTNVLVTVRAIADLINVPARTLYDRLNSICAFYPNLIWVKRKGIQYCPSPGK